MFIRKIVLHIKNFIFPVFCQVCTDFVPSRNLLCRICNKRIEKLGWFSFNYYKCFGLMFYNDISSSIIMKIKYGRNFSLIRKCGEIISTELFSHLATDKKIVIIPIPSHVKRTLSRGYSPVSCLSWEIFRNLKKTHNIELREDIIRKKYNVLQKNAKSTSERFSNASKAYAVDSKDINNYSIAVIVDDMITSGATISSCISLIDDYIEEIIIVTVGASRRFSPHTIEKCKTFYI